jgi:hypothetical protein
MNARRLGFGSILTAAALILTGSAVTAYAGPDRLAAVVARHQSERAMYLAGGVKLAVEPAAPARQAIWVSWNAAEEASSAWWSAAAADDILERALTAARMESSARSVAASYPSMVTAARSPASSAMAQATALPARPISAIHSVGVKTTFAIEVPQTGRQIPAAALLTPVPTQSESTRVVAARKSLATPTPPPLTVAEPSGGPLASVPRQDVSEAIPLALAPESSDAPPAVASPSANEPAPQPANVTPAPVLPTPTPTPPPTPTEPPFKPEFTPLPPQAWTLPPDRPSDRFRQFAAAVSAASLATQNTSVMAVYVENLFAFPVIQQPDDDWSFVSSQPNQITQYASAGQNNVTGLLAHNYLAGKDFFKLLPGMEIKIIYGDGSYRRYQVLGVYRYQQIQSPGQPETFIDLQTGETKSVTNVFDRFYRGIDQVAFQTCISQGGNDAWGLQFVVALPLAPDLK